MRGGAFRSIAVVALIFAVAAPASAANHVQLSPRELADILNNADARSVPYRRGVIAATDIRSIRCVGPDEEPTEFECRWRHRVGKRWVKRATWVAIDGRAWIVID